MQNTKQQSAAGRFLRFVLTLGLICLAVGALMGLVNHVTEPKIDALNEAAKTASLQQLFPNGTEFRAIGAEQLGSLDAAYMVCEGEELLGYVGQATVSGSQGLLDVIAGVEADGTTLTGIVVGPTRFAETSNIGSKTKEPAFTEQFIGLSLPAVAGANVDTVSGATVSSTAVLKAVNLIGETLKEICAQN